METPPGIPGASADSGFAIDPQRRIDTVVAEIQSAAFLSQFRDLDDQALTATSEPGTDLIKVTARAATDVAAVELANEVVTRYRERLGGEQLAIASARRRAALRAIDALGQRARTDADSTGAIDLRIELERLRAYVAAYGGENGAVLSGLAKTGPTQLLDPPSSVAKYGKVALGGLLGVVAALALLTLFSVRSTPRTPRYVPS